MRCPNKTEDEEGRLRAVAEHGLGQETTPGLDPIVGIAARMFDCPAAAVNIIGHETVFLTSAHGIDTYDPSRDVSFCAHAINGDDDVMVVEDATLDPRFHDNPLVASGWIHFYAGVPLRTADGHALGVLCVIDGKPHPQFSPQDRASLKEMAKLVLDKLELRRLQVAAASHPARFEASAATSPNAILCFDARSQITAWNDAAAAMFGRTASDALGLPVDMLVAEADKPIVHAGIARVLGGGLPRTEGTELTGTRADGGHFPIEIHWSRWLEGDAMHFGVIIRDMTVKKRDYDALYQLANYDKLTGLPNRNFLAGQVADILQSGMAMSLAVIDLVDFTDINNSLGHAAGDQVLCVVAERIRHCVPDAERVFRLSGDEFAVLLPGEQDHDRLEALAQAINRKLEQPIVVEAQEVWVSSNCGIALAPQHGRSFEELTSSAQLALFQAKGSGRGGVAHFVPALRADAMARRMHDAELHRALERGEFTLFYQPQVLLRDGNVVGAEALIRWKHPVRGVLAPAAFLPALEAGVLAAPTGKWVLDAACAQAAEWRRSHPEFRISVNLFSVQLRAGDLPEIVAETLRRHELPPEALELEITENIILDQQHSVLEQLTTLRDSGVALSFDDFGTGYGSMNLLKDYPVTHIKIDKGFTRVVQTSPKDRAIVMSLINLARQLGLRVVAEGVENAEDGMFLRALGCEKGQGYFYGKPMPPAVFAERYFSEEAQVLAG
ncbi:MAG: EAL domain-containing protein [Proteobacteria bacterium]|nr:EAL domain-containing protein [Pseudomonadota bacterium]